MYPKGLNLVTTVLLLLPFFTLAGVALQGAGYYLCAIALPIYYLGIKSKLDRSDLEKISFIAILLMTLYAIFPFTSVLNSLLGENLIPDHPLVTMVKLSYKKLLASQISSSIFASGIMILAFHYFSGRRHFSGQRPAPQTETTTSHLTWIYRHSFHKGLLYASCLLFLYTAYQHFTGFDYREEGYLLNSAKRMNESSNYRALGFFGHPLSLSGVSLCLFSYSWFLFLYYRKNEKKKNSKKKAIYLIFEDKLFWISLLQLIMLIFSGGRAAFLIGLGMIGLTPLVLYRTQIFSKKILASILVSVPLIFYFSLKMGLFIRFNELIVRFKGGQIDRFKFWQVYWDMFTDHPWIGHGYAWIKAYKRDYYYHKNGYALLEQKYNAHNTYLEVLANVGLLGALVLCVCIYFILKTYKCLLRSKDSRPYYYAFLMALLANLINALTQNVFFDSNVVYAYLALFWTSIWISATEKKTPIGNNTVLK